MVKCFVVGGAVRDMLMMRPSNDIDFVLTGCTATDVEKLISAGFSQVGADFPVFLHPVSGQEFALARTERKVAAGYNGFEVLTSPDLTIEDDLRRRDLTINSMAFEIPFDIDNAAACKFDIPTSFEWHHNDRRRIQFGNLIDPFGGLNDIENQVLRHTSEAFVEDPVRVLRIARFAARFSDFKIAPETQQLMIQMASSGELNHLVPERVFKEVEKAASEKAFSRFFAALPPACQMAIFKEHVSVVVNVSMFDMCVADVDTLQSVNQKIAFMFFLVDGIEKTLRMPNDIAQIIKVLNNSDIALGDETDLKQMIDATRKSGFMNSTSEGKFKDVFSVLNVVNKQAADFMHKTVMHMREVDVGAALEKIDQKPSFDLVTNIIFEKIKQHF